MSKNRWTHEQQHEVIKQAVILLRSHPTGMTRSQALREAQKNVPVSILPVEKRKASFTTHYRRVLEDGISALGSMPFNPKTESGPSVATSTDQELSAPTPIAPAPTGREALHGALDTFVDALIMAIVEGLKPQLAKLAPEPKKANGGAEHHEQAAAPKGLVRDFGDLPPKFHRPKVVIVGLRPRDHQLVTGDFRHIDFRFLEGFAKKSRLDELGARSDAMFLMTKFMSHVKVHNVKGTVVNVNGGMTDLKRLIGARFPKQTSIERVATRH